jgi:predicted nucleic acid-binding protein
MARSREAYVDTSALIAFLDRSDTHHAVFRRAFAAPPALVTTSLVVAEGHGWFLRRYDGTRALQFLAFVETLEPLAVLPAGAAEIRAGTALLQRYCDQALTLTDAVGLAQMRSRRIQECWSTDFHLRLDGARLLIDV